MWRRVRSLGESPKGFQAAGYGTRVSEATAWAGGTHEAGSETVSYDLSWFWHCEDVRVRWISSKSGVVGGKKETRNAEGGPE